MLVLLTRRWKREALPVLRVKKLTRTGARAGGNGLPSRKNATEKGTEGRNLSSYSITVQTMPRNNRRIPEY